MATRKDTGKGDYVVGYGRPPKPSQFQPGHSGNRKGRPPGSRSFSAAMKAAMGRKVSITVNNKTRLVSALEALLQKLISDALRNDKGSLRLVLPILERYAETPEGMARMGELLAEDREILARYLIGGEPAAGQQATQEQASSSSANESASDEDGHFEEDKS